LENLTLLKAIREPYDRELQRHCCKIYYTANSIAHFIYTSILH
jgi:hypothetical protein